MSEPHDPRLGPRDDRDDGGGDRPPAEPATPILRRLVIALVLCIVLAIGCWVLAPRVGVALPPLVPLAGFGVIAGGTLIGVWESRPKGHGPAPSTDEREGTDDWR